MKLYELTISQAAALLGRHELTSHELTLAVLERIHAVEDRVGAFITVSYTHLTLPTNREV